MISLVLWPTSGCNLHCKYCYAADVPRKNMTPQTLEAALKLSNGQPYQLQIAGGEPLCSPDMTRLMICRAAEDPLCKGISLQTNATRITHSAAELLAMYQVAVGVSLDGAPDVNESQRGATYEAIRGIRLLAEYGIQVNLTCVVTAYNVLQLAGTADLACYLGNVRGIGLDLLRAAGRAACPSVPQTLPAGEKELIKGLDALCARLEQLNRLLPPSRRIVLREEEKALAQLHAAHPCRDYCYAAQGRSYVVLPDGECYPCGSLTGDPRYNMGNVHHTIHPIELHAERPSACAHCSYAAYCTGGCPSRGLLSGGFDPLDCVVKKYMFHKHMH